jgi:PBSX family phage terminase large subunit
VIDKIDLKLNLSPKQLEFLANANAAYNIAHGAVRSGKTLCTLIAWMLFCYECPDSDLAIVGYSLETVYYNIIEPFMNLFGPYCSYVRSPGNTSLKFLDKSIRCIGASDQGAVGKIQGQTLSGAYVDEMTLIPMNFLDMLRTRLSKPHSKLFGTTNPDGPLHPIKSNLIDKTDDKHVYALHFSLEDNPSLSEDYKERLKKFYSGLWYKRYILGEWCMAEGAIYDFFDRKQHVRPSPHTAAQFYIVGIDYGTTNPFAMVVLGVNFKHSPKLWVEKEFYWDPKKTGRQKTDDEFADDLERELYGLPVKCIYIDPSAQSLEVCLKKRKKTVVHADNDVLNGIRVVSNFISQGDLVFCEAAQNLIKEVEGYVWDPKKIRLGEDAPLKQNDHACDALRYAIYTHFGKHQTLQQKSSADYFQEAEQRKYQANPMSYPGFTDSHGWQSFTGQGGLHGGTFGQGKR